MIDFDQQKRAAAKAAVAEVEPGMLVGLGTGSTAAFAIAELALRVRAGLRIKTVASSIATASAAAAAGLEVIDMGDVAHLDWAVDGVDQIDPQLRAIKGGGGALLREKIVAAAATRMVAIADGSKWVERLAGHRIPLEVLPFARSVVAAALAAMGGAPVLRVVQSGPVRTDQGNLLTDCRFPAEDDPATLAPILSQIPGVLAHGLFLTEIDALYVAQGDTVRLHQPGHAATTHAP